MSEKPEEGQQPPTQKSYELLLKKLRTCQELHVQKDNTIVELQEALKKVSPLKTAKQLSEGDIAELKIAREAYKTFSYTIDTDTYVIEVMVEPMSKTVDPLKFRLKR